ncbi:MAG: phosphoribosylanthranilate isomerase [Alphaproteobacteria bacterium]|nr:phosphoribosylanthranilate isomerase [Alphaproteobacteria bacterium]MDP6517177.1 phosphoribosylanthranilate isomerase [Alphaproteobacteria bacterium]
MAVAAKICGLTDPAAVAAAVAGGARYGGFVFYPPSPRSVSPAAAGALATGLGARVTAVGVFVDPGDDLLAEVLTHAPLGLIQLHGAETPERVAAVRARFAIPVIKAIAIAEADDLARAESYQPVADWLMFDAKPPKTMAGGLPGGNALAFDWRLLAGLDWRRPWMLSGGLKEDNLAEAVAISGARAVDVSSGVEDRPGTKSPARIGRFLDLARTL